MIDILDYSEDSLRIQSILDQAFVYIVDYGMSLRQAADEMCVSKSTLHTYIHQYLPDYDDDKWCQVKRRLQITKKYYNKPRKYQKVIRNL